MPCIPERGRGAALCPRHIASLQRLPGGAFWECFLLNLSSGKQRQHLTSLGKAGRCLLLCMENHGEISPNCHYVLSLLLTYCSSESPSKCVSFMQPEFPYTEGEDGCVTRPGGGGGGGGAFGTAG